MSDSLTCMADGCNAPATSHRYLDASGNVVGLCRLHRQKVLFEMPFRARGRIVTLVSSEEELTA